MPSAQSLHQLFHRTLCRHPIPISSLHLHIPALHSLLQIRSQSHSSPTPQYPSQKSPPSDPVQTNSNNVGSRNVTTNPNHSSLKDFEIAKFAAIAETWWDSDGPFRPLHSMNPTRVSFIRSTLCRHFRKDPYSARPLEGLKIVDVGCGGGILSEPMARMGASVTGIDAVEKNIKIARLHAGLDPLTSSIEYCCTTAEAAMLSGPVALVIKQQEMETSFETRLWPFMFLCESSMEKSKQLVERQRKFDAVIALEVIEHVADPSEFCKSLAALTDSNGATIISTINRSIRAFATAIVAAEYILHWLPKGTHQWSSFLTPEELVLILQRASISVQELAGFVYNPLTRKWSLSDDISVNFIASGTKNSH